MFDPEQQTTMDLIDSVLRDSAATERELAVAHRLMDALDEIELLHSDLNALERERNGGADEDA